LSHVFSSAAGAGRWGGRGRSAQTCRSGRRIRSCITSPCSSTNRRPSSSPLWMTRCRPLPTGTALRGPEGSYLLPRSSKS